MVPGEVLEFGKSQDPWECPFQSRCPERRRERDLPNTPVSKALPHHRDFGGLRCFHFGAGGLSGSTGIQYSGQPKLRHHWRSRAQTQVLQQAIAHSSGADCRQEPNVCGSCPHCGHKLTGAPGSAWQVSPQVCGCLVLTPQSSPGEQMNSNPRVFLIRHGETEFNRVGRYQGQSDSSLTSLGIRQARRNGKMLASLVDRSQAWRIVASPLGRTLHTAQLVSTEIGFDASQIELDERIQEIGFGWWEGLDRQSIEAREPGAWERRCSDHWNYAVQGGESMADVALRVATWLQELEGNVIAVSHGTTGRIIRGLYLGLTREQTLQLDQPQDIVFELCGNEVIRY